MIDGKVELKKLFVSKPPMNAIVGAFMSNIIFEFGAIQKLTIIVPWSNFNKKSLEVYLEDINLMFSFSLNQNNQ